MIGSHFFCEATQLSVLLLLHLIGTADVVGSHTKQLWHDGLLYTVAQTTALKQSLLKVAIIPSVCFSSQLNPFIRRQILKVQVQQNETRNDFTGND